MSCTPSVHRKVRAQAGVAAFADALASAWTEASLRMPVSVPAGWRREWFGDERSGRAHFPIEQKQGTHAPADLD